MSERIPESELIINADGSAFHLHILPEDLADNVILVGDPGRVEMVASFLDEWSITVNKESREFRTITGRYNGVPVSIISTGIGTDNIDIVMTELDALANIDFDTRLPKEEHRSLNILRIGTCGAIRPEIPLGGYIVSEMSCGFDGLLNWYTGIEEVGQKDIEAEFIKYMNWPERLAKPYFVKASKRIVDAFRDSAYCGITMSAPGFYGPQGRSVRTGIAIPDLIRKLEGFEFEGHHFTNIEMESSALAGLAGILGHEACTICLAIANRYAKESNPDYKPLMEGLIEHALGIITNL
ncbi:MAG: nucleoside phosphorylase [Bacteroidales bacterium]|nr:nucleoside phosphorylase [Bacteroidales bacterium]